jgi:hypothetical protein
MKHPDVAVGCDMHPPADAQRHVGHRSLPQSDRPAVMVWPDPLPGPGCLNRFSASITGAAKTGHAGRRGAGASRAGAGCSARRPDSAAEPRSVSRGLTRDSRAGSDRAAASRVTSSSAAASAARSRHLGRPSLGFGAGPSLPRGHGERPDGFPSGRGLGQVGAARERGENLGNSETAHETWAVGLFKNAGTKMND